MSRHSRVRTARVVCTAATVVLLLAACGSKGTSSATSTDPGTAGSASVSTEALTVTEVPPIGTSDTGSSPDATDTTAASTTVPAAPWSQVAQQVLRDVAAAHEGTIDAGEFVRRFFSLPVDAPVPAKAGVTTAYMVLDSSGDAGADDVRWDVAFGADVSAADIEQSITAGFNDPRFEQGVRVVSHVKDNDIVTLNYPATAMGKADGWGLLNFDIGPESDIDGLTGRQELGIGVERAMTRIDGLGLNGFLAGWLEEMPPLAEGLRLSELKADLVTLGPPAVWLEASYEAPADQYERVVRYYTQDFTKGDLQFGAGSPPNDLTTSEYFSAGFMPTLAGFTVFVTVQRRLSDPQAPLRVTYQVRVEPQVG